MQRQDHRAGRKGQLSEFLSEMIGKELHDKDDHKDSQDDRGGIGILEQVKGDLQLLPDTSGADEPQNNR